MIETVTFPGAPAGMNVAVAPHDIPDTQARYIIDGLLYEDGFINRRGPVTFAGSLASAKLYGVACTEDPQGTPTCIIPYVHSTGFHFLASASFSGTSVIVTQVSGETLSTIGTYGGAYPVFDSSPALGGGAMVGVSTGYETGVTQSLYRWNGGIGQVGTTTATSTIVVGATTFTISALTAANLSPGMFVFRAPGALGSAEYVGCVKSISGGTITLDGPALKTSAVSPNSIVNGEFVHFDNVRSVVPRVTVGRITTTSGSPAVTGTDTKFKEQGLATGTWDIYQETSLLYLGTVSGSPASATSLTLAANAPLSLDNEGYIALKRNAAWYGINTSPDVGFLTATYAGRQFYANRGTPSFSGADQTNRIWFSDVTQPEAIDMTEGSGSYIDVPGTNQAAGNIRALASAENALLIIKENEVQALFGTTTDQWQVRKIADDGALSAMSVQTTNMGVIWAGRRGIYLFDGTQVTNLTEGSLGDYWTTRLQGVDPATYRMWSMVARDHYFVTIEHLSADVSILKGASTTSYSTITVALNLKTGAVTFLTPNVSLRGAARVEPSVGVGTIWISFGSGTGGVHNSNDLFTADAGPDVATPSGAAGPSFYLESKRYSLGDGQRKKLWKQLQLWFTARPNVGGTEDLTQVLGVDTVPGINDTGTATASGFLQRNTFRDKRLKFLKRDQYFGFRVYEATTLKHVKLGTWALGYKWQRPGRI